MSEYVNPFRIDSPHNTSVMASIVQADGTDKYSEESMLIVVLAEKFSGLIDYQCCTCMR